MRAKRQEKVLVIAPYPVVDPRHGGQKRTKALVENYKKFFEEVQFIGIFHKASYPSHAASDIPLGDVKNLEKIDQSPLALDQIVGKSIDNDSHVRSFFAKALLEFNPDIIHVEQVYLYDGLSKLLDELRLSPILIFGSQNIEYMMKKRIYNDLLLPKEQAALLVDETRELERRFSREADLVVAVSKEDGAEHRRMGAKRVVIAPNGVDALTEAMAQDSQYSSWRMEQGISTVIAFIGSGHPPNYLGVLRLIGQDTSFLPSDSRIVLGGGVSEYFKVKYPKKQYPAFWKRLIGAGMLSEDHLIDLIRNTDVFILPILSGGGSNLKTAEAILANKKIVATEYAFRGFEPYLKLPNIHIANDKATFQKAIQYAIETPFVTRSPQEEELAQTVQWEYCLKPIYPALVRGIYLRMVKDVYKRAIRVVRRVLNRLR